MKTVTFNETTHAVVPRRIPYEMVAAYNHLMANWEGFTPAIEKAIASAPPYQSVEASAMAWIPCSERYPLDRASVLVYCSGSGCVGIAHYMSKFNYWTTPEPQAVSVDCITYWMNLPAAPKGKSK